MIRSQRRQRYDLPHHVPEKDQSLVVVHPLLCSQNCACTCAYLAPARAPLAWLTPAREAWSTVKQHLCNTHNYFIHMCTYTHAISASRTNATWYDKKFVSTARNALRTAPKARLRPHPPPSHHVESTWRQEPRFPDSGLNATMSSLASLHSSSQCVSASPLVSPHQRRGDTERFQKQFRIQHADKNNSVGGCLISFHYSVVVFPHFLCEAAVAPPFNSAHDINTRFLCNCISFTRFQKCNLARRNSWCFCVSASVHFRLPVSTLASEVASVFVCILSVCVPACGLSLHLSACVACFQCRLPAHWTQAAGISSTMLDQQKSLLHVVALHCLCLIVV